MSKKNTNKHIIWSNYNLNLDNWMEGIKENLDINGVDYSDWPESKFEDEMWILNREYFYDEQANLNIPTEGHIIAIVDLGLWNGRRMGYKFKAEKNIKACLSFDADCEYGEWYVDSHNNLRSIQSHHDGQNLLLYREVKPEISPEQLSNFCWKLYRGKATSKDITKYTRSIGKRVKNVYGW